MKKTAAMNESRKLYVSYIQELHQAPTRFTNNSIKPSSTSKKDSNPLSQKNGATRYCN